MSHGAEEAVKDAHRDGCECGRCRSNAAFYTGKQDAEWGIAYMPPLVSSAERSHYDIGYAVGLGRYEEAS